MDVERGLAEEMVAALGVQLQHLPLDCADAGLAHIAIARRQVAGMVGAIGQHRLQVAQVQQQQAFVIGVAKGDRQHAFLRIVEAHEPRQKQRPHLADRRAHGMALPPVQVPEYRRIVGIAVIADPDLLRAGHQLVGILRGRGSRHRYAGQVALHIGEEYGNAARGKTLGQRLERYRLASPGSARDQAVPVGAAQVQRLGNAAVLFR